MSHHERKINFTIIIIIIKKDALNGTVPLCHVHGSVVGAGTKLQAKGRKVAGLIPEEVTGLVS